MEYLVVRTSMMEVSATIEAESPEEAAMKFDIIHQAAAPIVLETTPHPGVQIEFEPLDQSVWDPSKEEDEPVWTVDL